MEYNAYTEQIRKSIIGILLGEGGLDSDFCPDKQDQNLNLLMQKIRSRLLTDEVFATELTDRLVEVYYEKCARNGVSPTIGNVPIVLYPYQCCLQAAYISKTIFVEEDKMKR